jgi:chemotaxis protein histidine kinase CheA
MCYNRYIYSNMKPLRGHVTVRDGSNTISQANLKLPYTTAIYICTFVSQQARE